jgi:hypothetical protein
VAVNRSAATGSAAIYAAGEFVYCRGSNVASAGQFVNIQNGSAVLAASANSSRALPVGVAAGALTATNVYGWVQVRGRCDYARCTNHSFAADIPLYLGTTAGFLGSVYLAGGQVFGAVAPASLHSSLSAGSMTFILDRPFQPGGAIASSN